MCCDRTSSDTDGVEGRPWPVCVDTGGRTAHVTVSPGGGQQSIRLHCHRPRPRQHRVALGKVHTHPCAGDSEEGQQSTNAQLIPAPRASLHVGRGAEGKKGHLPSCQGRPPGDPRPGLLTTRCWAGTGRAGGPCREATPVRLPLEAMAAFQETNNVHTRALQTVKCCPSVKTVLVSTHQRCMDASASCWGQREQSSSSKRARKDPHRAKLAPTGWDQNGPAVPGSRDAAPVPPDYKRPAGRQLWGSCLDTRH